MSLQSQLKQKVEYWVVGGATGAGKTSVSKYIAAEYGYKLLEYEAYKQSIKEKLLNPDEGEEVPLKKYLEYFKNLFAAGCNSTCKNKQVYILDCLPCQAKDLEQWVNIVGVPTVINLDVAENQQIKRTRKKNQGDLAAEVTEQQTAKAKQTTAKNAQWIQNLTQISPQARVFTVDYNPPQILAQNSINSILKPRIYLIQQNDNLVYQNIALKNDLGFINLHINQLRQCQAIVKNCKKRDVILCYYSNCQKLTSDDLYWIEKNLGQIRYLGIWVPQDKCAVEEKLVLQRPEEEKKKQPVQGEEGEKAPQEPPAEQGEEGTKKKMDIYSYQWSKPTSHKNLSQWFFKLKNNVTERKNQPKQCYQKFEEVLNIINGDCKAYVYQVIQ